MASRSASRATSSIRSASRWTSPSRSGGTVAASFEPFGLPLAFTSKPRRSRRAAQVSESISIPISASTFGTLRVTTRGFGSAVCSSIVPGTIVAPTSSTSSRDATDIPRGPAAPAMQDPSRSARSTRCARPSRSDVRRMVWPSKSPTSSEHAGGRRRETSANSAPKMPAITAGRSVACDRESSTRRSTRSWPSRVTSAPRPARRAMTSIPSRRLVQVEGVERLPGQQHHVVGDVHDVVDGPLPAAPRAAPSASGRGATRTSVNTRAMYRGTGRGRGPPPTRGRGLCRSPTGRRGRTRRRPPAGRR